MMPPNTFMMCRVKLSDHSVNEAPCDSYYDCLSIGSVSAKERATDVIKVCKSAILWKSKSRHQNSLWHFLMHQSQKREYCEYQHHYDSLINK